MKKKVGKEYLLPGETRTNNRNQLIWCAVFGVLLIGWLSFIITQSILTENFWDGSKDMLGIIVVSNFPTLILLICFLCRFKEEKFVRKTEILIHRFEEWDTDKSEYQTHYIVDEVDLCSTYICGFYTEDYIYKVSEEEIINEFDSSPWPRPKYPTQEDAMRSIISTVKQMIANDKSSEHVKIKNVQTLETFSVGELKEKFEAGDYDYLYEKKEDKDNKE